MLTWGIRQIQRDSESKVGPNVRQARRQQVWGRKPLPARVHTTQHDLLRHLPCNLCRQQVVPPPLTSINLSRWLCSGLVCPPSTQRLSFMAPPLLSSRGRHWLWHVNSLRRKPTRVGCSCRPGLQATPSGCRGRLAGLAAASLTRLAASSLGISGRQTNHGRPRAPSSHPITLPLPQTARPPPIRPGGLARDSTITSRCS